ncbi:phosphatase PAP2 family protein [Patescibacteria group bacterium]|nr:phosphatase PAP2 family protein [Patescibacteria group bacterium]
MTKKTIWKVLIIGFLLTCLSFFFDEIVAEGIRLMRSDYLTAAMHFITDFGLVLLVALIGVTVMFQKKYRFILFMCISVVVALQVGFILKAIFQVPRPYLLLDEIPLFYASGYSFPSMHAAFVFSLLPYQKYFFKNFGRVMMVALICLIAFSRMYLGVHNFSDIVFGAMLGLLSTYTFVWVERKAKLIEWFEAKVNDTLELRRQAAHLILGTVIVILIKLQLISVQILFIITFFGGILVLFARKIRLPIIHKLLEFFERPHHMAKFPGRGSFFLVLGSALAVLIFEKNIAMASIMIMAVGDSVTNIVGRHFGSIQNPFNSKKNLEGTGFAIITSALAAFYFVPFLPALIASTLAMVVESIDLGWKRFNIDIDDNVTIPLVAGVVMTVMMF